MRALVIAIIILGLGLSACGRRGAPELPEGAEDTPPDTFVLDDLIAPKRKPY